jgi:predicted AAA+ superfamily ATPase
VHLKSLHDVGTLTRFVVSGSANAALDRGSRESGAGRFTDFLLPPLTFAEFLHMRDVAQLVAHDEGGLFATDIEELNREFIRYLNFGGYPEVALGPDLQANPVRFMRSDIIDKVLLRDLPSLYGITDVRELNRLFTMLALNSGKELSLEGLAGKSAVSKNTLKRYIAYLEAAFLIRTVTRVDQHAGRFQRDRTYKVFLTNPSLRTGLFSPLSEQDEALGSLVETGIFAQRFHRLGEQLHYARWKAGASDQELDLIELDPALRPREAVEIKFTDRVAKQPGSWGPWIHFCRGNRLDTLTITTRTHDGTADAGGIRIRFEPAAIHAYRLGIEDPRVD